MMILFLIRNPLSYFQSYKNYFLAIYLVFLGFPAADLMLIASSQPEILRLANQLISTSGVSIAVIWGYVATKLYVYPETLSLKRFFSRPIRPILGIYAIYLIPMIIATIVNWGDASSIIISSSTHVTFVFDSVTLPTAILGPRILVIGLAVVVAFTSYPFVILTRRRALIKDKEVRRALQVIASAFSIISIILLTSLTLSSLGYSISGLANLLSEALIVVAVFAFRRPTFLKSFLGVVPSLESSPTASRYDQTILLHAPGEEKFGPIAKYIIEGVNQRERVIYFNSGDVPLVTASLSRQGVDVTRLMLKGALRMPPLGELYPRKGVIDETPLQLVQQLAVEAKTLGNEGLRVILDYDDFVVRPLSRFVQHLTDTRWTSPDHSLHVLMTFDSTAFRGEEGSLSELERKVRTVDLSESRDTFSQTVGLSHQEISGRKLLLESDPTGDYERIFKSLLAETSSNFERTVVFTRRDSPIYSLAVRHPGTKIFVLTSRVSYPKMENENLFLLPSYDTSLLLDSLNKTIEAYSGSAFTIIFDSISQFVLTLGPDRTYSLVRQALELMVSDKITAIFSMNSKAHDQKVLSTFENMFDLELVCRAGRSVPEIRKKLASMS
jgi:DcmR-like sensory protein